MRRLDAADALPVEYIVETRAKGNIYCPMRLRETQKQPKEDIVPVANLELTDNMELAPHSLSPSIWP